MRLVFNYVGEATFTKKGFSIFPLFGVDSFHDTRFENGVEMIFYLNEDVFALAVILAVEIDNGVGIGAATSEEVECSVFTLGRNRPDKFLIQPDGMTIGKM